MPIYNNLSLALRPPLCHPGLSCALSSRVVSQGWAWREGSAGEDHRARRPQRRPRGQAASLGGSHPSSLWVLLQEGRRESVYSMGRGQEWGGAVCVITTSGLLGLTLGPEDGHMGLPGAFLSGLGSQNALAGVDLG